MSEESPALAVRRLHPVVDRYVTTDISLGTLVQAVPAPRTPLLESILSLNDCLDGRSLAKDAISRASVVDFHDADPELLVLFLSLWAELSCRISRPSEASALIHRGRTLIGETTHPEVRAALDLADGLLADTLGNKLAAEKLLRGVLDYVSEHSPRRKFYAWELAFFLALQGRASEFEESLKDLAWRCNDRFPVARVLLVRFVDALETGRGRDASHLMTDIATTPQIARELRRVRYRGYQFILRLIHASDGQLPEPGAAEPDWVRVAHALLSRDPAKALALARAEASKTLGALFDSGFSSYNMIRAELANGAWEGAKRLLDMRRSRGNTHYLDDLFLARAELLAGNRQRARQRFLQLMEAIRRYDARGRLDFELRLACELNPGDIVFLSQAQHDAPGQRKPEPQTPAEPSPPPRKPRDGMSAIVGKSRAIRSLKEDIARFAPLESPVLISGETGTGKELVARALHDASPRSGHSFIAVNCGAITDTLLESELFGHERGAFTGAERANKGIFEDAGKGTVFLDEIGDISPRLQGALLRVLETGEARAVGSPKPRTVLCRIIAATNVELGELAGGGRFRSDLLFRLKRLEIQVPPLRERREDIPLLMRHFLDVGRPIGQHATATSELEALFAAYDWPGNVRELRNVIERMRLMHSDKALYHVPDVDMKLQQQAPPAQAVATPAQAATTHEEARRESKVREVEARSPENVLAGGRSTVRRIERLKELFGQHPKLTRGEIIQIMDVSPNTATKDLKVLCDENFIRRVEPSASSRSYYFEVVEVQGLEP